MKNPLSEQADELRYIKLQPNTGTGLSCREIASLQLAAHGKTAGEIAAAMAVTERTAQFHIANAIDKLGAANKTHAVALALRRGLLE